MLKKLLPVVLMVSLIVLTGCSEDGSGSNVDAEDVTTFDLDEALASSLAESNDPLVPRFTTEAYEAAAARYDEDDICTLADMLLTFPSGPQTEDQADTGLQLYADLFDAIVQFLEDPDQITAYQEAAAMLRAEIIGSGGALEFLNSSRMSDEWDIEHLDEGSLWLESQVNECFNGSASSQD